MNDERLLDQRRNERERIPESTIHTLSLVWTGIHTEGFGATSQEEDGAD